MRAAKRLNALFRGLAGALLVAVILFEEWGWEALRAVMAWLGRWPPLAALDRRITRLPPYAALAVLMVPALTVLPLKLLGVWLLTRGHVLWSLALVLSAKLAGTAVLAHLFALTQPALMRLPWFARGYTRWVAWKTELLHWARASAIWQSAARWRRRVANALARWRARQPGAGRPPGP